MNNFAKKLHETFGDSIAMVPGITRVGAAGARDEREAVEIVEPCPHCKQLPINGVCGCGDACPACRMLPIDGSCECGGLSESVDPEQCAECGMYEMDGTCECKMKEGKKKGPSKKAAKSWIAGTKKFSDKVAKAKRAGVEDPAAFAAWMQHRATGKWPSEK